MGSECIYIDIVYHGDDNIVGSKNGKKSAIFRENFEKKVFYCRGHKGSLGVKKILGLSYQDFGLNLSPNAISCEKSVFATKMRDQKF